RRRQRRPAGRDVGPPRASRHRFLPRRSISVTRMTGMDAILTALAEQQAELLGLLAPLDDSGWQRPSACEGWTVADVVLHVAQTWIHTGDVAAGLGVTLPPTERLWHIARLAWRTLPYAFGRAGRTLHGPVTFELRGPGGDSWDFVPDEEPATVIRGDGVELCL